MGQVHGVTSGTRVLPGAAQQVARVMAGLGTASRVEILGRLREGACSVGALADAVHMAQPAVSHQLRILRDLNLVVGVRTGRQTIYGLYDPHVAVLLDEALRHIGHLRADTSQTPLPGPLSTDQSTSGAQMTEEHTHQAPHTHAHEHDGESHVHPHVDHDHQHVDHEHEHAHDGTTHSHPHIHEAGVEEVHEHQH